MRNLRCSQRDSQHQIHSYGKILCEPESLLMFDRRRTSFGA